MKFKSITGLIALFTMMAAAPVYAGNVISQEDVANAANNEQVNTQFLLEQVKRQQRLDFLLAPIKSRSDLGQYMANTPGYISPLEVLSPGAKGRFLGSLKFNENGLVSFDYGDIEAELTATQAYELLSLFGVQRTVSMMDGLDVTNESDRLIMISPNMLPDHDNYECIKRATCGYNINTICMSGC